MVSNVLSIKEHELCGQQLTHKLTFKIKLFINNKSKCVYFCHLLHVCIICRPTFHVYSSCVYLLYFTYVAAFGEINK